MTTSRLSKKIKNDSIFLAAKGVMALAAKVPLFSGLKLGAAIGRAAFFLLRPDRAKVLRHLKIAFPDSSVEWRKKVGAESFANLGKGFFEMFHFDEIFRGEGRFKDYIRMDGVENMQNAADAGLGGVMVTGHIGNWEIMAAYASHLGHQVRPVVRSLYDERIDKLLNDHRRKYGYPPIARGDEEGFQEILELLQNRKFLGILMDQDTKVRGAFVPFLGQIAHTPTGPAYLACSMGIDVMTGFNHRTPDGRIVVTISKPYPRPMTGDRKADILSYTRLLNDRISDHIREHPTEWVWMHRRWKKRPPDEPSHLNPDPKPLPKGWKRIGVPLGEKIFLSMPQEAALRAARLFGRGARYFLPSLRRLARENMNTVFRERFSEKELRALEKQSWSRLGETFGEYFFLKNLSPEDPEHRFEVEGLAHLDAALSSGKGAVFAAMHIGSFDTGLMRLTRRGYPIGIVDRSTKDRFLCAWLARVRSKNGLGTYAPDAKIEVFEKAIERKESLVFFLDGDGPEPGMTGSVFFGRDFRANAAPIVLARQTGARLLTIRCERPDIHTRRVAIAPVEMTGGDSEIARELLRQWETTVAEKPDQWIWTRRLFG